MAPRDAPTAYLPLGICMKIMYPTRGGKTDRTQRKKYGKAPRPGAAAPHRPSLGKHFLEYEEAFSPASTSSFTFKLQLRWQEPPHPLLSSSGTSPSPQTQLRTTSPRSHLSPYPPLKRPIPFTSPTHPDAPPLISEAPRASKRPVPALTRRRSGGSGRRCLIWPIRDTTATRKF